MSSTLASAQGGLEIPLQFDFVNPGAKSLALGGAFAGVADDATASFANPAGLTLLLTPEVSGELRFSPAKDLVPRGRQALRPHYTDVALARPDAPGPEAMPSPEGPVFGHRTLSCRGWGCVPQARDRHAGAGQLLAHR